MKQIRLLVIILFSIALGMYACQNTADTSGEDDSESKTNIIFILADDLGYGDLGSYGQQVLNTPNLDQMAQEGIRFTQAYAGNTVCSPSRSSLMTGLHPGHARHRGNYGDYKGHKAYIPFEQGTNTIATHLKDLGYTTALIGKWHLGGTIADSTSPNFMGFDHYFGNFKNFLWTQKVKASMRGKIEPMHNDTIWRNQDLVIIEENLNQAKQKHNDDLYTEEALRYLALPKDQPFFLYLSYHTPHAPQLPYDEGPYAKKEWPEVERKFAADVYSLDRYVGKVLQTLKKLEIDDNTLVLFSSDNGAHHEGGHDHTFFDSNGSLRGYKRDMYDGGIKVPMIARWPAKIKGGRTTDHICAFWDLMPTFTDVAGKKVTTNTDGISFLPTLLGQVEDQEQHDYLYWEIMEQGGRQGVRMGKWKGIRYEVDNNGFDTPIELYDVSLDEGEQDNIAVQHPEVAGRIEQIMKEARVPNQFFKFTWEQH